MQGNLYKYILLLLVIVLFALPILSFAHAGGTPTPPSIISLPNPLSADTFQALLNSLINWMLALALPVVVALVAYAGFLYMAGGVSPAQQNKATKVIMYALIGYAIVILSKMILGVIYGIFA